MREQQQYETSTTARDHPREFIALEPAQRYVSVLFLIICHVFSFMLWLYVGKVAFYSDYRVTRECIPALIWKFY